MTYQKRDFKDMDLNIFREQTSKFLHKDILCKKRVRENWLFCFYEKQILQVDA